MPGCCRVHCESAYDCIDMQKTLSYIAREHIAREPHPGVRVEGALDVASEQAWRDKYSGIIVSFERIRCNAEAHRHLLADVSQQSHGFWPLFSAMARRVYATSCDSPLPDVRFTASLTEGCDLLIGQVCAWFWCQEASQLLLLL